MLKTNLEILEYVHSCPDHTADADSLATFIGDASEKRLSDLFHDHLLSRSSNWYGYGSTVYSLTGKGFDLLAQSQQAHNQRAKDRSYQASRDARAQDQAEYLAVRSRHTAIFCAIISAVVSAIMSILVRLLFG